MDVSEARRLKGLEDENARLKRLLADAMLHNAALKGLSEKKYGPPRYCKVYVGDAPAFRKCIRPVISQPLLAARP